METILSRFEPASRIEDTFFHAELNITAPGLAKLLPSSETLLSTYLPEIDIDCTRQIERLSARVPGDFTIACDGVQIGNCNNLLFTKAKGPVTQYLGLVQLEDEVHVTTAEAEAGCKIVSEVLACDSGKCASIAVDNAAVNMAEVMRTLTSGIRNEEGTKSSII